MSLYGIEERARFPRQYGSSKRPHPFWNWYGAPPAFDDGDGPPADRPFRYLALRHGIGYVLDPCIGKGRTAELALRYGLFVVGFELIPERLEYTVDFVERRTRQERIQFL